MYVTTLEGARARLRGRQEADVGREPNFFPWNFVAELSHLAFETTGHGATNENHLLNDGAYLMTMEDAFDVTLEAIIKKVRKLRKDIIDVETNDEFDEPKMFSIDRFKEKFVYLEEQEGKEGKNLFASNAL
ncbi:hypothetical protein Tco_1086224 [Tanacetum coccineum]